MAIAKASEKYQIDMCRGPLLKQIITFVVPLMFSGILQLVFHSTDLMIVGRFASHQALAAIGVTTSVIHLLVNIFFGLSVGTNVLVSRYLGAKDRNAVFRAVHTAVYLSLVGGVIIGVAGMILTGPIFRCMEVPEDIIDMSCLYTRIYFAGLPMTILYNFGSAILRASGDTKRPFYFLVLAGFINVFLNLFFVVVCRWPVGGVATATIIAQTVSALLVLRVLVTSRTSCRVRLNMLRIHWKTFRDMMWIGIPAGFQASSFSVANILIQTALNSFGSAAIAGCTAANTWEVFCYVTNGSFGQTATSFVSQNFGGKQYGRIRKTVKYCSFLAVSAQLVLSLLLWSFGEAALSLFNTDPEVIKWGILRFSIILPFVLGCGVMETFVGTLRGLGHVAGPTIIMICSVCVFRVIWLNTAFASHHTMAVLIWSYPTSWMLAIAALGIYYYFVQRKLPDAADK